MASRGPYSATRPAEARAALRAAGVDVSRINSPSYLSRLANRQARGEVLTTPAGRKAARGHATTPEHGSVRKHMHRGERGRRYQEIHPRNVESRRDVLEAVAQVRGPRGRAHAHDFIKCGFHVWFYDYHNDEKIHEAWWGAAPDRITIQETIRDPDTSFTDESGQTFFRPEKLAADLLGIPLGDPIVRTSGIILCDDMWFAWGAQKPAGA